MKQLLSILTMLCFGILSAQTYHIGDVYTAPDGSQGIVYYLHPNGSGGWVVALTDASTGCAWGASTDVPGLSNQNPSYSQNLLNDTAGYANTQTLRSYQNNSTTYAAGKVDFAHGWVLPSPAQLSMLYGQLPFIASAITGEGGTTLAYANYWCSAENSASDAWSVEFGSNSISGDFNNIDKTTSCCVRAVRSFSNTALVYDTALTYVWNTGSTQPYLNVSPSQTTTYMVTATTDFGCSNTAEQTIVVGDGLPQTIYDTVCQGSDYEANGFTLTSAETGTSGTLTRTRTLETYGCSSTITLQLTVKSTVTKLIEASFCENYTWNGVTYYESGDYTQTFTAANGCDSVVTLRLTQDSAFPVHITGSSFLCENSTVELTVDSAVAYLWSTGETVRTIQVDSAGAYSVTVTDGNGCTSTAWHHIAVLENPISSVDILELCMGGSYTLTVGHNLESNVRLHNNETTLSKEEIVFLPDGIDCEPYGSYYRSYVNFTSFAPDDTISSADDILYVRLKMEHSAVEDIQIQIFCPNNNSATILPQPNFESTYDNSTSPATPQLFRVNLGSAYRPDGGGCSSEINPIGEPWNYIWSNNSTLGYQYASDNGNLCSPNNFISHYNPHWDTELSPFFDTLHSYSVDSTNVAQMSQVYHPYQSFSSLVGCPLNGNWYIQVQDMLEYDNGYIVEWELALNPETLPLASLDYDYVTVDGPWLTTLNDSSFVVNPPADLEHDTVISYTFTVHYENGCEFDTTVNVTVYAASHTLIDTVVCEMFEWNGVIYTGPENISMNYTNVHGCDSIVTLHFIVNRSTNNDSTVVTCDSYEWHDSTYSVSGTYVYEYINEYGCASADTLHLTIIAASPVHITGSSFLCENSTVELTVDSAVVYLWSTGENVRTIQVDSAGAYSVTVTDGNGCTSTAWHHIAMMENPISSVYIPEMCSGNSYSLTVGYDPENSLQLHNIETTLSRDDVVFLPDGIYCEPYGSSYRSYINFTAFAPDAAITSANDILYLRLKIEHSAVEDLRISLVCPNGNRCKIVPDYQYDGWGNVPIIHRTNLGVANRLQEVVSCDSTQNPKGIAWNYVWSNNSVLGYQYANTPNGYCYESGNVHSSANPYWDNGSTSYKIDSTDVANMTQVYHPLESFAGMAGCPLNGNWYIEIEDLWVNDNGYLHEWELALNPETLPLASLDYDYVTVDGPWLTTLNDSSFVVNPPADLQHDTVILYTFTMHYENGCEFDTTVNVTVYAASHTLIDTVVCEMFEWNGVIYTGPENISMNYTNVHGCDSIVTLHFIVNRSTNNDSTVVTCDSYEWHDSTYSVSGTYVYEYTNEYDCHSVDTLHLMVYNGTHNVFDTTVCESYEWHGTIYTISDTYTYAYTNEYGCFSVDTLHLTVNYVTDSTLFATVMENTLPYIFNDSTYTLPGTYYQHFTNVLGCDSTLTIQLMVCYNQTVEVDSTVCENLLPLTWNDSIFTEAGMKICVYLAANGADSIVVMTLHVNPLPTAAITGLTALCGDSVVTLTADSAFSYRWSTGDTTRSIAVAEEGFYTLTVTNEYGCEAVATHQLSSLGNPILSVMVPNMCAGGTYTLSVGHQDGNNIHLGHGETTLPDMAFEFDYSTVDGPWLTTLSDTLFQITPPANLEHDTTVAYTFTVYDTIGCGYDTTVNITFYAIRHTDIDTTVCESFTWNDSVYTLNGQYVQTFTSAVGCDSIVTVNLIVNTMTYGDTTAVACESFTWRGVEYTATPTVAPTYTITGGNHNGCDSIVTLHLTVNHGTHNVSEETVCEGYEWHGTTYTESDTYTYAYTNGNGCASEDTLHLTVHYGTHNVTDTIVCESCEWQGTLYTESGTYTYAYTNADECPSTDTLHLTVSPVYEFSFEDVICEGEAYNGHGFEVSSAQTVGVGDTSLTKTLQSQHGCDSILNLKLTIIDTSLRIVMLTEDFCDNQSMELMVETTMEDYVWSTDEHAPTITVTQAGIYSVTATQGGCEATAQVSVVACHYEFYLPNAITPSRGDGLNDYFSIPESNRREMATFEISIFNRWGELVFYSTDKNFKWNGEYKDRIYYETIYNYVIRYRDTSGKPYVRTGSIIVL